MRELLSTYEHLRDGYWPSSTPTHSDWLSSPQARAGFMLNIIGVLVITLAINTWSIPMFDLHRFPSWAQSNTTGFCGVSQANVTTPSP